MVNERVRNMQGLLIKEDGMYVVLRGEYLALWILSYDHLMHTIAKLACSKSTEAFVNMRLEKSCPVPEMGQLVHP